MNWNEAPTAPSHRQLVQPRAARQWAFISMIAVALLVGALCRAAEPATAKTDDTNSQEVLRAYLQLQEQLHASQLAIEQNRREWKEAVAQNEEALAQRLRGIEQALAAQRSRELDAMQSSNKVMLIVAGSFAAVGFVAMLIMAYFQWRTVNGLAEISAMLPAARALGPGHMLAIGPGDASLAATEQSNARLLGALGQLEKRLHDLEHTAAHDIEPVKPALPSNGNGNGHSAKAEPQNGAEARTAEADNAEDKQVRKLLAKGESLLDQNKAEAALACFDQVLAQSPNEPEALVKKGLALERLQKLQEAIEYYDRAIASDASMTIAYLHKGGLCNRLERFNEALECYEKALRTQEKRQA